MRTAFKIVIALLFSVSMSVAQTAKYADIISGHSKLPYGKAVTLTGKLNDLKCGTRTIPDLLKVTDISASYLGQLAPAGTGTISGQDWSAPLGTLPPDTAIHLGLKVTGKINEAAAGRIAYQLITSDQFERGLQAFFQLTRDQGPTVVTEEATRFVRNLSDQNGALTVILQAELPCISVSEVSSSTATAFLVNLPALANPTSRLRDLRALNLDGLGRDASAPEAYTFVRVHLVCDANNLCQENPQNPFKRGGQTLPTDQPPDHVEHQQALETASVFKRDYEGFLSAFVGSNVIVQLSAGALLDISAVTSDLQKYAGFDAGAIYIPRIEELRQFFMANIYPWGPVELDTNGLLKKNFKNCFSLSLGVSVGDISGNNDSRVRNNKAFVYGFGYRINKYFRISAGGAVFRDSRTNDLHNEAFVGPSIDLTALPGLKQIFASASGSSNK